MEYSHSWPDSFRNLECTWRHIRTTANGVIAEHHASVERLFAKTKEADQPESHLTDLNTVSLTEQSMALVDAQVHFLDERLVLVHIPLELYPYFLKPVLKLIFNEIPPLEDTEERKEEDAPQGIGYGPEHSPPAAQPAFMNVSITPVEVSVICPRRLVVKHFEPLLDELDRVDSSLRSRLLVSENDYIAMQVLGQGLEAGKRVLDLTSPLAMAGISIFFISTYFSDYILVPLHSKASVMSALESRGFQFDQATDTFVNPLSSPTSPRTERRLSNAMQPSVTPPPPSTLAELQTRTFDSLRKLQISPYVDDSLRLVQCAAHHQYNREESSMSILREALTAVLLVDDPRFLSLTLAALDPAASLLLEKRLLPRFARHSNSHQDYEDGSGLLLGSKEDSLIPIMLDLRDLPMEASGIVCGVAGRLAEATGCNPTTTSQEIDTVISSNASIVGNSHDSSATGAVSTLFDAVSARLAQSATQSEKTPSAHRLGPPSTHHHLQRDVDPWADAVEISFLSTARAGTIIVGEDELRRAIDALEAEKMQDSSPEDVPMDSENVVEAA